jgi:formate-dependent nitrite reductase membrane component NrfD
MNWLHRIGLIGSILAYIFGFVLLHQGLGREEYIYFLFFGTSIERNIVIDTGFLFIGLGFVLQLLLYFTKQKDQIISIGASQPTNIKTPMNLELANHQLVEAILIIRPFKKGTIPKVHLATQEVTGIPITPEILQILNQANATELASVEIQPQ